MQAANYPEAMLKNSYTMLPYVFNRDAVAEIAESRIGIPKKGEAVLAEAQSRLSKMLEKSWLETTSLTYE